MIPSILLLGLYLTEALAFPALFSGSFANQKATELSGADHPCPHVKQQYKRQAPGIAPPFDAAQQYVSNTGTHRFVAPGPNDQRGPCKQFVLHCSRGPHADLR